MRERGRTPGGGRPKVVAKNRVSIRGREVMSSSPEETHRLGIRIGRGLCVPAVVLLHGPLGSGKTTFARGIAVGLGVEDGTQVCSPSYALVNIYRGRCPIYHVDLYRLSGEREVRSIGLDDFLGREGVTIVEWSERLGSVDLPALEVNLEDAGENKRRLRISHRGKLGIRRMKRSTLSQEGSWE